jgi:hypothetical protein
MSAYWQKLCDKQKAQAGSNGEETKEADFCSTDYAGFAGLEQYNVDDMSTAYTGSGSPAAVALAARLLLDLRVAHTKPGHQN